VRWLLLGCAIGAAVACGAPRATTPKGSPPEVVTSNVLRGDYAGSASCASCHQEIAAKFAASPMHNMTRDAKSAAIVAPFDGTVFHFKNDFATLETHHGARYVRLDAAEKGQSIVYRITKVIGGRHREDFAGIEVSSIDEGAKAVGDGEKILPISFMRGSRTLRYKGYSVMEKERPGMRASGEWRKRCIFCHNTEPYLDVILGGILGDAAKPYQGVVVDRLLPAARRATYTVTDDEAFRTALFKEVRLLDANDATYVARASDNPTAIDRATSSMRARFDEQHLLELGIGCESCHGGSREHVDDPRTKPSYLPRAPWLSYAPPKNTDVRAQSITRTCAHCHQVLFSAYPFAWEGSLRAKDPGGSNINSGEARDFLLGGCASKMTCTNCHDPHAKGAAARADNAVCTGCHQKYEKSEALKAHAHHDPSGAGGSCVGCHMPAKNMGLDGRLTRYHRIGSPSDKVRVEGDRPLECALCHANKTVGELVTNIEQWWGKSFDRAALKLLYGELDSSVILATLDRGKPHEQAVAIAIAGDAELRPAVPYLVRHTTHSLPLLRYWAVDALAKVFGSAPSIDLHRDNAKIEKDARAWVAAKGYVLP